MLEQPQSPFLNEQAWNFLSLLDAYVEVDRLHFMRLALEEATKCETVPPIFRVGCVITVPTLGLDGTVTQKVLSTGYTRELGGVTHAEENALTKAHALAGTSDLRQAFGEGAEPSALLRLADVYTTLEPCSVRFSGVTSCADALTSAEVRTCIIKDAGVRDRVVKEGGFPLLCDGAKKLRDAGINVIWWDDLEEGRLGIARGDQ